jgi:glycosyltransferase EpsF
MKKVLIITYKLDIGGLENVLMNYFRNINRNELQVDFLINEKGETDYTREVKALGSNVYYADRLGKQGLIKYIKSLVYIIKNNGSYDVIHVNMEQRGGIACLAGLIAGVKVRICHSHTTNVAAMYSKVLMPLYRLFIKISATKRLACGMSAGRFMLGKKFEVLPNGINVDKFANVDKSLVKSFKNSYGLSDNAVLLGHVARLSKEKNQLFLIELLAELSKSDANYRLIIVGDGEEKNKILKFAEEKGVIDRIIFTGFREDVNVLMNVFDIFLLPSFYEGLPLTVVEAQAAGVQCILSNNITTEVDLELGLVEFLSVKDVSAWASFILNFRKKVISKDLISTKFQERCYDIKACVSRLETYYGI